MSRRTGSVNAALGVFVVGTLAAAAIGQDTVSAGLWSDKVAWARSAQAFYVAPDGKPTNTGSKTSPWDIRSALEGQHAIAPGSVVWLRGGTYGKGGATVYKVTGLRGSEQRPIIIRGYPGERATINGGLKGATGAAWIWLWGFEVTNSDPNRKGDRKTRPRGIDVAARGLKCINLIIHETAGATSNWKTIGDGGELYGNVMWGCGVYTTRHIGGGTYAQNTDGTRYLRDNISFRQFVTGLDGHSSGTAHVNGFHVEGNVCFDNSDWGYHFFTKTHPVRRLKVIDNFSYYKRGERGGKSTFQAGYHEAQSDDIEMRSNYFVIGPQDRAFFIKNFSKIILTGNTIVGPKLLFRMEKPDRKQLTFDANHYYGGSGSPFRLDGKDYDFSQWRGVTGQEAKSTYSTKYPDTNRIFVRPNLYEPGRGHVIVYNWAMKPHVLVDLSGVLTKGALYEIRDAQNYFGEPVAKGKYTGDKVRVSMQLKDIARPIGQCPHIEWTFRHTAPEFAVFVVLTPRKMP